MNKQIKFQLNEIISSTSISTNRSQKSIPSPNSSQSIERSPLQGIEIPKPHPYIAKINNLLVSTIMIVVNLQFKDKVEFVSVIKPIGKHGIQNGHVTAHEYIPHEQTQMNENQLF